MSTTSFNPDPSSGDDSSKRKQSNVEFNPSGVSQLGSFFGLPYGVEEADLLVLPVPWDVTVSYGEGTRNGPEHILEASCQLDLELPRIKNAWSYPMALLELSQERKAEAVKLRAKAQEYIHWLEKGKSYPEQALMEAIPPSINTASTELLRWVKSQALKWLNDGKLVAVLGGDHSTPLGLIQALAERHESFGILQIDAHMDLRKSYEDFQYSHASIMYNALQSPQVERLVQVGIRDYCQEELDFVARHSGRVKVYYDHDLKSRMFEGSLWKNLVNEMVSQLPKKVYISFDIDGLEPSLCPGTGTPVPGGLSFEQASYLIRELVKSQREIIGFDLCEVSPREHDEEWNANVGARVLYHLAVMTGISRKKLMMD